MILFKVIMCPNLYLSANIINPVPNVLVVVAKKYVHKSVVHHVGKSLGITINYSDKSANIVLPPRPLWDYKKIYALSREEIDPQE